MEILAMIYGTLITAGYGLFFYFNSGDRAH